MNKTQLTYEQWLQETGIQEEFEECWECSTGTQSCDCCNGDGRIECDECEGEGKIIEYDGDDNQIEIKCTECDEGYIDCPDCDGCGDIECDTCQGECQINNTKEEYDRQFELDKQIIKGLK
jgi:hypothetical protein